MKRAKAAAADAPSSSIAVIADSHVCEDSRFDECVRLHDWIADDIAKRKPSAVLHAGDVYERKSTPTERRAVAAWVQKVTEVAPIIIVRGNHDVVGDLPLLQRLKTKHPVIVEEAYGVHRVGGISVAALAWPRKAHFLAAVGHTASSEETSGLASDAIRNVLRGLGGACDAGPPGPRVLLAHAMVCGSKTSTGQPLVGCDMELGLEDLALARADFFALGHIHLGQDWQSLEGAPIVYPGSPRRTAFGELEAKGYVVASFNGGERAWTASWERVEVPATRMLLVDCVFEPGAGLTIAHEIDVRGGAEVRLRYLVASEHRDAARAIAESCRSYLLAAGASHVKVEEEVVATVRARAPEVAAAKTLPDKLKALWKARGLEISPEREARVLAKLAGVEAA